MAAEQDLRRALGGSIFFRDIRGVEPTKKGWIVGETVSAAASRLAFGFSAHGSQLKKYSISSVAS